MTSGLPRPGRRSLRFLGVLLVLAVLLAGLIALSGARPLPVFAALWQGAFGGRYMTAETLTAMVPLALVGLGVLPALRAGVFPIGAQGQLVAGAGCATAVILALPPVPAPVYWLAGAAAGAAGGAGFALLPAWLRAARGVSEILSTLLLNYIAGFGLLWALKGPLAAARMTPTPQSDPLPDAACLPLLLPDTRLHVALLAVPVLGLAMAAWMRSRHGLRQAIFAERPDLAARLGLGETRAVIGTMVLSGAVSGLAGWVQVAGVAQTLYPSVDGGIGFSGILVAVLGALSPLGTIAAAFLFAVLATGAQGMQMGTGVPSAIAVVVQGLVLLAAAVVMSRRFAAGKAPA